MVHAHENKSKHARKTVTRVLAIAAISFISILALATAPKLVVNAKLSPAVSARSVRGNQRIRAFAGAPTVEPSAPMPFAAISVDRTDDVVAASACTPAANDCSLRGAVAFANLNPGTTINIPAGTYQLNIPGGAVEGFSGNNSIGDIDVTANNTSIVGAGAASTIIQQTQPNDRVLEVNPNLLANFTFDISGVTLNGGKETTAVGGGGIIAGSVNNTTSITNCVISGNSASGTGTFGGGGIQLEGGSLTITGTTFSGNSSTTSGGAVVYTAGDPLIRTPSTGTLTITGSTFSGNSANSTSAGGGALDLFDFNLGVGTYSINSSSFSSNTAGTGNGGAIIVESGPITVTTSSFANNTAGNRGGAIFSSGSATVTYSRLTGNSVPTATNGLTLFNGGSSFTANDNWWGSNAGPSANDFRNSTGPLFPLSYLQLSITATPNEICTGATSTLTADIRHRNTGATLTTELNGLPTFPAIFSNASLGTLSGATNFVNGAASATFTGGATSGSGGADVTADNQTVSASITVNTNSTTDPGDQALCEGQTATFSTTTSGPGTATYVWKKGATVLNSGDLGGRVVITSGANSSSLSISNVQAGDADTYTVDATGTCNTSTQSATLTVNPGTTTSDPADQSVCQGTSATFSTTASGTGPFHYAWTLDGSPFNGDSPSITIPTGSLSIGAHTVTVTTTGTCNSATQTATLAVTSPTPVINLSATSASVWPPNHQYQTFNVSNFVSSATGGCDSSTNLTNSVVIQKVSSDEPENGNGDGNTFNDIVIAPDCKSVQLRRERDGNKNGRVYTITFKVTDSFGNSATATVKVYVPLNNNGGAVDDGPAAGYTVNSACP